MEKNGVCDGVYIDIVVVYKLYLKVGCVAMLSKTLKEARSYSLGFGSIS